LQKIVVYADEGVDGGSLKQLMRSLQQETDPACTQLIRMDAAEILGMEWEKETALIVFPGGRDTFYHKALEGAGTEKIYGYVSQGGSYLGLCAGAYFACSGIEFEKEGSLAVCEERSLKFFPGIAKGSAYGPNKYSYENCRGVEAALISSEWGNCLAYFNGGCTFEASEHYPQVKILSRYLDLEGAPPAVLEIQVGKGRVILSGVHIEYTSRLLKSDDPYLASHLPKFEKSEGVRRQIFRSYLKSLGLLLTN
jgi:glutamine amidotransferase-like uncharacterized protein